jgi:rfaE bifunctional protein kinase chain/domain
MRRSAEAVVHAESQKALDALRQVTHSGRRIAFVSGNFNVVHPGHLRLLKFAADCGDYLVVGVNGGQAPSVVVSEELRLEGVAAISIVDFAFVLRDPPEAFIAQLCPAIVVKGKEHEGQSNPEKAIVESYGGSLLFSSGEMTFSSLDLIRREFSERNLTGLAKPADFPRRHGFTTAGLKTILRKFARLRVLVIGDLIVDEYIACDPIGMSQEDPTIVVTPILSEQFVGGAGIVAAHASRLGATTKFITIVGKDPSARFAAEKLASYGVDAAFFEDDSRPTSLKQRFRASGKTLLRVSHLKHHGIEAELRDKIVDAIKSDIKAFDLVIFADFNYGCLPQKLVDDIAALCEANGVAMVADSQSSSQVGDVSRFRNMLLLTPTEREARLALHDSNSGLVVLAQALRERSHAKNVILTLGAEGVLVHANAEAPAGWLTDQLPAFNPAPKDAAGAGDSFLTCASLALLAGANIWQSAYLGSLAAACQVGRVGNLPLSVEEIEAEIDS